MKSRCNLLIMGNFGHGKSTLAAALTRVSKDQGWSPSMQSYEHVVSGAYPHPKAILSTAISHIECMRPNRVYALKDCAQHLDTIKTLIAYSPEMFPNGEQLDGAILVISVPHGLGPEAREQVRVARQVGIRAITVFLNKLDLIDSRQTQDSVETETRNLLSEYQFPGETAHVIRGSARQALDGEKSAIADEAILKLYDALDQSIRSPELAADKPFLMALTRYSRFQALERRSQAGSSVVGSRSVMKFRLWGCGIPWPQLSLA
jgi:elongation factor Tu